MFDRSFLPKANFEFVIIADTHYMLDPTGKQVEFNSRRRQTARAEVAFQQIASFNGSQPPPLLVHMGDLIQEFPEQPDFAQARAEALAQLARHELNPRLVAGNHDVGDKPDPTMPASWVTAEFLADYQTNFGRSWYSWTMANLHFVVLNSQIMNSTLPEAQAQEAWLVADLAQHADKRIFLFLHLPPFIHDAAEPHLGHYDNLGEPARGRLLALLERHQVERLFAAHIHWAFYNQIGKTRLQTVPSVAFTRPGFSELFSSGPPAEQGRDDVAKLGFYLVRVHEKDSRVHFIRTNGATEATAPLSATATRVVTGTPADLPHSPLGLIARHPIAPTGYVPSAWPSTIRQRVRNDSSFLATIELGVRHLRVPVADLGDPVQGERLHYLREQGVTLTAQWLYEPATHLTALLTDLAEQIDHLEIALPGAFWPDEQLLQQLAALQENTSIPLILSCVVPGHRVRGKQHNRSQIGYLPEQLVELNQRLAHHQSRIDRACCRLDGDYSEIITTLQQIPMLSQIRALDWLYTIPIGTEQDQVNGAASALFALCQRPQDRLFLEPYVTLDRTMDAGPGLLDRAYNPNPAFHPLRHLNTLLYYQRVLATAPIVVTAAADHLRLSTELGSHALSLLLPLSTSPVTISAVTPAAFGNQVALRSGMIQPWQQPATITITEPTLFYGKLEAT